MKTPTPPVLHEVDRAASDTKGPKQCGEDANKQYEQLEFDFENEDDDPSSETQSPQDDKSPSQ